MTHNQHFAVFGLALLFMLALAGFELLWPSASARSGSIPIVDMPGPIDLSSLTSQFLLPPTIPQPGACILVTESGMLREVASCGCVKENNSAR